MELKHRRALKKSLFILMIIFILMNIIACFHAYKFTHFDTSASSKTKDAAHLSVSDKITTLLFGINNPRPKNKWLPDKPYESIILKSNKRIECWYIKAEKPIGTVILFHGYSGDKSGSIKEADVFLNLGYNTLLVDFMGSGGSEGNQTTIGFFESLEVKTAFDYIKNTGEKNIILFGTSMGAAAIMKCLNDSQLDVKGIIIECPFGSMLKTVQARFKPMHIPSFPMANLLVFWGGVQNNFNAFGHNPIQYAKNIKCPVLLMYGQKDDKVSYKEIEDIYQNLHSPKQLQLFPLAGHEDYLKMYSQKWVIDVTAFLSSL
ncbi:lysophospholipase [Mucilaginibacter sp. HMF5004]|uniref:alpha/beta hydrolase n=1 Tax=Mucilaginibacter rivuli TaxID=2857527 RepID=UPI001C5CEF46|nr:alpha/beta fold hydrolase [Mucilaginibacter rivuli]MBW4891615.1 lysophospholipase [Mucilaginibacter rivuli]